MMIKEIWLLFSISLFLGILFDRLKLPKFLAFSIAGFIGQVTHSHLINLEILGKMGMFILLFCLGAELSIQHLRRLVPFIIPSFITIAVSSLGITLILTSFLSGTASFFVGIATSLSSTAIIIMFLKDKKLVNSTIGQFSFCLLICQDLIAIMTLIFIQQTSPMVFILSMLFFVFALVFSYNFINRFLQYIYLKHKELFLLMIWTILFSFIVLANQLNLSEELGAFCAGVFIANSQVTVKIESYTNFFKNIFMIFFFAEIGHNFDLNFVLLEYKSIFFYLLSFIGCRILTTIISGIKFIKFSKLFTISLITNNVSEASFLILKKLYQKGIISSHQAKILDLVFVLMIFLSPIVIFIGSFMNTKHVLHDADSSEYEVVICNHDIFTNAVAENLTNFNIPFVFINDNVEVFLKLKNKQFPVILGNIFSENERIKHKIQKAKIFLFTSYDQHILKQIIFFKKTQEDKNIVVLTKSPSVFKLLSSNNINCINIPGSSVINDILKSMNLSEEKCLS